MACLPSHLSSLAPCLGLACLAISLPRGRPVQSSRAPLSFPIHPATPIPQAPGGTALEALLSAPGPACPPRHHITHASRPSSSPPSPSTAHRRLPHRTAPRADTNRRVLGVGTVCCPSRGLPSSRAPPQTPNWPSQLPVARHTAPTFRLDTTRLQLDSTTIRPSSIRLDSRLRCLRSAARPRPPRLARIPARPARDFECRHHPRPRVYRTRIRARGCICFGERICLRPCRSRPRSTLPDDTALVFPPVETPRRSRRASFRLAATFGEHLSRR